PISCDLSIHAVLHLRSFNRNKQGLKFGVPIVQEVLANDRHLEVPERPPGEANINDYVAGDLETRQALDVTNGAIDLEVVGQIHRRTQTELVVRVPALIKFAGGVPAARIAMELILKD